MKNQQKALKANWKEPVQKIQIGKTIEPVLLDCDGNSLCYGDKVKFGNYVGIGIPV